MATEDRVMTILAHANPAPDVDALPLVEIEPATYLTTLEQRSSHMAQVTTRPNEERVDERQRRVPWLAAAAVIVVAAIAAVVLVRDSEPVEPAAPPVTGAAMSDAELTVEAYVAAFNSGDLEAVMALFTEESIIVGHPFSGGVPADSLGRIRSVQQADLSAAADENAYVFFSVRAAGDTVAWNQTYERATGEQFCTAGHEAVVRDGIILSWTWPADFGC